MIKEDDRVMVVFRSRRLEALIGAPIAEATYAQFANLARSTPESEDLDFKGTLYPSSPEGAKSCRGDVAAMANTMGGVIILGIAEGKNGQPGTAPGVSCTDAEIRHIYQVLGGINPFLPVDVRALEDPALSGHGFIIISVPRSTMAPHAVVGKDSIKFPRRNGSTTYYLGEGQLAEAYRARFTSMTERIGEAERIEKEFVTKIGPTQPFSVVTLVPDFPGDAQVGMDSFLSFQRDTVGKNPHIVASHSIDFAAAFVRRRCFIATDSADISQLIFSLGCELHQNGAGSFASGVGVGSEGEPGRDTERAASGQAIVESLASGIKLLTQHASNRAAASGQATLRATVWPVGPENSVRLANHWGDATPALLAKARTLYHAPVSETVENMEFLAIDGPHLLKAAHRLASGIYQEFGIPDCSQLSPEGEIRQKYWSGPYLTYLRSWAAGCGVSILNT